MSSAFRVYRVKENSTIRGCMFSRRVMRINLYTTTTSSSTENKIVLFIYYNMS